MSSLGTNFPHPVTSPKRKVPRTSHFSCPYKTGVPEQHLSSVNFTLIVLLRGERGRTETALAPLGRQEQLAFLHHFLREWGAIGWGGLPSRLSAYAARRSQGKGWDPLPCKCRRVGPGWHALACPLAARMGQRGQGPRATGNGGARGGVTSRAPCPREWGTRFRTNGEGRGWRVCSGVPFPRVLGGVAKGKGEGPEGDGERGWHADRVPSRAPLPRVRGGEVKGEGEGLMAAASSVPLWEGVGVMPMRRGGAVCNHAPPIPCEWSGAEQREGVGAGLTWRGGAGHMPSHAPFPRERGGGKREGEEGGGNAERQGGVP
ncbi:hypothetical protein EDB89DRAFT_1904091 [Lactarius sanguifluus]|nr:hypothetical protein EDB89DRAFT_1904091 [Lactarius sanguifluus]